MPTTILHLTDSHAGLRSALMMPGTKLVYDNGETKEYPIECLSARSVWLLEKYNKLIDTTIAYADGDPVIVFHTAELCHGSQYPDYLYSPWLDHQVQIAISVMAELRRIPTLAGFRLCYGSKEHDYGQQSATKLVADGMAAWGYPVQCVEMGREIDDGCLIAWQHYGPKRGKGQDRTQGARSFIIRFTRAYLERGQRAPDIFLCGHFHERLTEPINVHWGRDGQNVLLSIGAPLCCPNEYARTFISDSPFTEVGGTLIKIDNGRVLDYQAVTYEYENRIHVEGVVAHPYHNGNNANAGQ